MKTETVKIVASGLVCVVLAYLSLEYNSMFAGVGSFFALIQCID